MLAAAQPAGGCFAAAALPWPVEARSRGMLTAGSAQSPGAAGLSSQLAKALRSWPTRPSKESQPPGCGQGEHGECRRCPRLTSQVVPRTRHARTEGTPVRWAIGTACDATAPGINVASRAGLSPFCLPELPCPEAGFARRPAPLKGAAACAWRPWRGSAPDAEVLLAINWCSAPRSGRGGSRAPPCGARSSSSRP